MGHGWGEFGDGSEEQYGHADDAASVVGMERGSCICATLYVVAYSGIIRHDVKRLEVQNDTGPDSVECIAYLFVQLFQYKHLSNALLLQKAKFSFVLCDDDLATDCSCE